MESPKFDRAVALLAALALGLVASGCETGQESKGPGGNGNPPAADGRPASDSSTAPPPQEMLPSYDLPFVEWSWDPTPGDPAVPAELGGPGFTGEGWQTRTRAPALGSPDAVRGGTARRHLPDWPATLRQAGENWNTSFNYTAGSLIYESLLGIDPLTLEPVPGLATHWQISDDRTTYRFRIDARARFSNGEEVTADDVVATWKLRVDPGLRDPSSLMTYGKLHQPVAVSKYIVEVRVKEESWRNFLYFSGMSVFPASAVGDITGAGYLDRYQFAYVPGTGPYIVRDADIVQGQSIALTRRDDYWNEDHPTQRGLHNIERLEFVVVKDEGLAFEKLKKGELDIFYVPKAQWWVEEVPRIDGVRRGWIQPRKFWNDRPIGTSGIALNMGRAPLDDLRVRQALQLLYNRELMIEKLFFDEYAPLQSYYQGGVYQNPSNPPLPYDPLRAVELLEEAGWSEVNDAGIRTKDGRELRLRLVYPNALTEPSLTLFQEDARAAGIALDLQLLTPAAAWKALQEKQYEMMSIGWGALVFPNPETSFSSRLADQTGNNNVTAFSDPRVDELLAEYDIEYDVGRRIEIIREIDGRIYAEQPYVLGWYLAPVRVLYSGKFAMPPWGIGPLSDAGDEFFYWWVDPKRKAAVEAAQRDSSLTLPSQPVENRFWQTRRERAAETVD
jgi:microcin C transport system substrate-binding protein